MSSTKTMFLQLRDKYGNDMFFGEADSVRFPAFEYIKDYSQQLDRIRQVELRSDDVIVVGYPKSGNNWAHHMICMLLQGTTQLAEIHGKNNYIYLDGFDDERCLPLPDKPRVLLSHLPFRYLPRDVDEKKVKIVYVTRNPKDVFVSTFCHVSQVHAPLGYGGTWPQFFEHMLEQGFWYGDMFEHLKDWEKQIESHPQQPIFRAKYEDTKKDTMGQVELLNQFLATNRSKQLCQAIVDTCTLDNMRVSRKMDEDMIRNTFLWKEGVPSHGIFRKGVVGDWKNWFTVAQNEQFDTTYQTKMADYQHTFVYE